MNDIGHIISHYRKQNNMSQQELADLLQKKGFKISYKAVSKWETNVSEPGINLFFEICRLLHIEDIYEEYFGFNPYNPFNGLNETGINKANEYISDLKLIDKYLSISNKTVSITRYLDIYENAVSAGTGNYLFDGPVTSCIIDNSKSVPDNADFGVMISGDSMEPLFHNGEVAIIHHADTLSSGDIGIFSLNNNAYIKKFSLKNGIISLISLNTDYNPIGVTANDDFKIFGKVVGTCKKELLFNS